MYTSEIRETDNDGKPVAVAPVLLTQVRAADDALRERLDYDSELEYTGRWVFPEQGKAILSIQVRIPNEAEAFAVSLLLNQQSAERFAGRAVQSVLIQADKALQARINRRLHNLLISTAEGE